MYPRLALWLGLATLVAWLPLSAFAAAQAPPLVQDPLAPGGQVFTPTEFVPGELIVRFEPGVDAAERAEARRDEGATLEATLPVSGLQLVNVDPDLSVRDAEAAFEDRPEVRYAEPNFIRRTSATPNDVDFGQLWGLRNTGQTVNGAAGTADADIDAPEAWDHGTGSSSVQVAVIDTGISYAHPDLAANVWTNPGETGSGKETNGLDDDSNGRVDDWRGFDFVGSGDNDPFDSEGHGTHVAGTIGAAGNNAAGVSGVNWAVQLMALRSCGTFGSCTSADVIEGIAYAGAMGAEVANMSLGGTVFSQAESDAIAAAPSTLFVVAAGNDAANNDTTPHYPCNYSPSNIVCVAATDQNDALASFSDYGATSVDLAAPGKSVYSSHPYLTVMRDDFETALAGRWTTGGTGNTWERDTVNYFSPTHDLADSPGAAYANSVDSFARLTNGLDLTVGTLCDAEYRFNLFVATGDTLKFELSEDGTAWTTKVNHTTTSLNARTRTSTLTTGFTNLSAFLLRYRMTTNASGTDDGAYVDDLHVRCHLNRYDFLNGTSMAAPHVTGAAALAKAVKPAASVTDLKNAVLTVDAIPALTGVVASGGRLNAHKALIALDDGSPPDTSITSGPSGLTGDATPTFEFTATEVHSTFECRVDSDPFAACTSPHTTSTLGDGAHTFDVKATDEAGNPDASEATASFTVDASTPATPSIADTDPDSPANDAMPEVKGTADSGTTVKLYKNATCSGSPDATGSAATFTGGGITVTVPENASTTLTATATNGVGNTSGCSSTFVYTEDSTAPAAPSITDTDPDSPADETQPEVKGTAEAGSTVKLYESSDCTGPVEAEGPAADFASPGLTVTVADDSTNQLTATAVDGAGNVSPCSTAFTYTEASTAPGTPAITDTDPDSPSNDNSPEVKGTVGSGSPTTVKLYKNGSCTGSPAATGSVASFTGSGITVTVDSDATTSLTARASNGVYDSGCSAPFSYTEDSTARAAPEITDTDPDSPSSDNNPLVRGTGGTGDGVPDAALAVAGDDLVSLFRGSGGGAFTGPTNMTAPDGPRAIAVSDFNRDGEQDIVTANGGSSANNLAVFVGTAGMGFASATEISLSGGDTPFALAVGDFNGDDDPDIAVALPSGPVVKVLLGATGATFTGPTAYPVDLQPWSVTVGDWNGDGADDLATANSVNDTTSILVGAGDGTFGAATNFATGDFSTDIASGDFNGDGDPDLAVSNRTSDDVSILTGGAGATFGAPTAHFLGGQPKAVAVGDFNLDGDPDVSVTQGTSHQVAILLGSVGSTFTGPTEYGVGSDPRDVAVGDFNLDGDPDLAIAAWGELEMTVLLGAAGGTFTGGPTTNYMAIRPDAVALGDFDNDGSQVRIYDNGACSGSPAATGSAASFNGDGIAVTVASDQTTNLSATVVDPVGNVSDCSDAFAYTEDSTAPGAPAITDSEPDSPSSDGAPELRGTVAAGTATVKLYKNGTCSGSPDASGTAAAFTSSGITVTVTADATTTLSARGVDAAGNESACSSSFTYVEDSTAPGAPTITDTDPDSPANDNNPEVKGTVGGGSPTQVRVFYNGVCGGDPVVESEVFSVAQFTGAGVTLSTPIADNGTRSFSARAIDAAGNESTCSNSLTYVEDSAAPAAPSITDTDPDSPADDNEPEVKGTAEAGSTVRLFKNGTCSGAPDVTGTAASFTGAGITVTVPGDATTTLTAQAVDAAGNGSACSSTFSYTEDSTAPAAPSITDTDPDSPATDNNPEVKGTVGAGTATVKLYKNGTCSGTPDATGTVASFTGAGITVTVTGDATTTLTARGVDAAGNESACSASFTYVEDSTAPGAPTITDTDPDSPANDNNPEVKGSVGGGSPTHVRVFYNGACGGDPVVESQVFTVAEFTGAGVTLSTPIPDNGTRNFSARAIDAAGNESACSNSLTYVEDSTAPAAPSITDTDPDSPANDNQPEVKGTAEAGSTVVLFKDGSCSGAAAGIGTAATFTGGGIALTVPDDATTTLTVRATDPAGNTSPCSDPFAYTEDSTAPGAPAITDSEPDSPSSDGAPELRGTVATGTATVKLYENGTCSGSPDATGTAAAFTSSGITVTVTADATTTLSARGVDAAGNESTCSGTFTYVEDSTAPAAPTITDTDPDSPANDNNPEVKGTAEAGSTVRVYESGDCTGPVSVQGPAADFAGAGLTVNVAGDQTTTLSATATDVVGNVSACSDAVDYVEDSSVPDAPTLTDTDPDSPANDNSPEVKGTVGGGSPVQVKLYDNDDCSGTPDATGTVAAFTGAGITVAVAGDTTTDLSARTTNALGTDSACSNSISYTEDSTGPAAPAITDTEPDSPSTDSAPEVRGTADAGTSQVEIFKNGTCSGSPAVTGTAAAFTGGGVTVTGMTANGTTTLTARAVDAAGNTSACSSSFAYTHDTTNPAAPAITDTNPDSPANDNNPEVRGTAEAGATVQVFRNTGCDATPDATGTAAAFNDGGITLTVPDDSASFLYARAVDGAGNVGPCSDEFTPPLYTEDSTAPAAPSITDTDPDSPANDSAPEVLGTAEVGSTVKLHKSGDCSGAVAASGLSGEFGSPGITVAVTDDQTTQLTATATDAAGNVSPCSTAVSYTEDSTGPAAPSITGTDPATPSNDNTPLVQGTVGSGSPTTVKIYKNGSCSGSPAATGSVGDFTGAGIEVSVSSDATTTLTARTADALGNESGCSGLFSYAEDSTAPDTPVFTGVSPASPANDNQPEVAGFADDGTTVRLYESSSCGGSVEAQGTPAQFASGLPVNVANDVTTQFTARATDAAGNASGCSSMLPYTEDSTAPASPTITDTDADSPANDNNPEVKGTVAAGSTQVDLFKNATCFGSPDASGTAASFTGAGITVNVGEDATTTLSARARDGAGNASACSASASYVEDSTAPAAPSITDTDPDSPANHNNPHAKGTVGSGSPTQVKLYKNANCSGAPDTVAPVTDFTGQGIGASVGDDTSTTFTARTTDAAGNDSGCSDAVSFTEDSTPPPAPTITGTSPASPADNTNPAVQGTATGDATTVSVWSNGSCTGSPAGTAGAATFGGAGINVGVADNATTNLSARGTDAAGNVSGCSTPFAYTETNQPSAPPDGDGDGVPDSSDQCPSQPAQTPTGCPAPQPPPDGDGDGVPDSTDQCPTQPASTPTGCPPVQPAPDADGDGVPDATDPEPNNPNVPGAFGATNVDDVLNGDINPNTICGLLGNDTINGQAGNDTLFGDACGATAKRIFGAQVGTGGDDKLNGNDGNDVLYGAGGKDTLKGGKGNDKLFGGDGNDTVSGEAGRDRLDGGNGNDRLTGGADANTYKAGAGNDVVNARNRKRETIDCGSGRKDRASVDKADRVRGCEKVTRART